MSGACEFLIVRGHCERCGADANAEICGEHIVHDADQVCSSHPNYHLIDGQHIYRILRCQGCEKCT